MIRESMARRTERLPTPIPIPTRRVLAAVILSVTLGFAAASELGRDIVTTDLDRLGHDAVSLYQRRFERLKPLLGDASRVGYFCGLPPERLRANPQETARYYLAQYALAPTIVANDLDQGLLVGNFGAAGIPPRLLAEFGLVMVRNLGGGVFLLARAEK